MPVISSDHGRIRDAAIRLALLVACLLTVWSLYDGWYWSLLRLTSTFCEEEGLFPVWKFAKNQAVYADPYSIPFSSSYFNWLFFFVYGGVAKILLPLFHLEDGALPAITRLVTLGFGATSVAIVYAILGLLNPARLVESRLARFACSLFVIVDPLTHSWLYTTRPDIAATTCELFGFWCALRHISTTGRLEFLLGAVIASYAAWCFKQNYVHLLGGFCLFLLLHRRWRQLGLVMMVFSGLLGATLLLGNAEYRHALIGAQMNCRFNLADSWGIFRKAIGLAPQLLATTAALAAAGLTRRRWSTSPTGDLLKATAAVALVVGFLGAAKQGADFNYFIPACAFGMLWGLSLFPTAVGDTSESSRLTVAFRWAIAAMFCIGVANGLLPAARKVMAELLGLGEVADKVIYSNIGRDLARLRQHLQELPGPAFLTERPANLPWMQTKAPHFVYSFTYVLDRKVGQPFEKGGIGGLIESGYFETIVVLERGCACEVSGRPPAPCVHVTMNYLPLVYDAEVPSLDGGRMSRYRLAFQDGAFTYYRKRE
jgi:hypothetical protein